MKPNFPSLLAPGLLSLTRTVMAFQTGNTKGSSLVVRSGSDNNQVVTNTTSQARTARYLYLALTCLYPIIALAVCLILYQAISEWMAASSPFLSLPTSRVP